MIRIVKKLGTLLFFPLYVCFAILTILGLFAPFIEVAFFPFIQIFTAGLGLMGFFHLAAVAVFWGRSRKWTLAAICLFLLCLWIGIKDYNWPEPAPETGQPSISVLSYNLGAFDFRASNVQAAVELFRKLGPDVMSFQEFRNHENENGEKALEYIARELNMDYYAFIHLPLHVHGAAIFSRFPIYKMDTLYLPREEINSGILATIEGPSGKIGIANLHMSSFNISRTMKTRKHWRQRIKDLNEKSTEVLLSQQDKAESVLAKLDDYPYPFVVTGDFNAPPHSRIASQFSRKMQDSFLVRGEGLGWTFPFLWRLGIRIDYQFVSDELEILAHEVIVSEVSDHFPIMARYSLKP